MNKDNLPRASGSKDQANGDATPAGLLLIDDDPTVRVTYGRTLSAAGYSVVLAATAAEAFARARERLPDLALVDIHLPDMLGVDLARRLWDESGIPFVFLTEFTDAEFSRRAVELGAVGYLVKPIDAHQLLPPVATALARARDITALREAGGRLGAALSTSREISMAVGLLMERHRLGREAAFERLRGKARARRQKVEDLARELLEAIEKLDATD